MNHLQLPRNGVTMRTKEVDRNTAIEAILNGTKPVMYTNPPLRDMMPLYVDMNTSLHNFLGANKYFMEDPVLKIEFDASILDCELATEFTHHWEGKHVHVIVEEVDQ
jgi:hypothetical protein